MLNPLLDVWQNILQICIVLKCFFFSTGKFCKIILPLFLLLKKIKAINYVKVAVWQRWSNISNTPPLKLTMCDSERYSPVTKKKSSNLIKRYILFASIRTWRPALLSKCNRFATLATLGVAPRWRLPADAALVRGLPGGTSYMAVEANDALCCRS